MRQNTISASIIIMLGMLFSPFSGDAVLHGQIVQLSDKQNNQFAAMRSKAVAYLQNIGQAEDGSFSGESGPGITSIVTVALIRNGVTEADPAVAKALNYLLGFRRPDGGIYQEGSLYRNYETCLAILFLSKPTRTVNTTRSLSALTPLCGKSKLAATVRLPAIKMNSVVQVTVSISGQI